MLLNTQALQQTTPEALNPKAPNHSVLSLLGTPLCLRCGLLAFGLRASSPSYKRDTKARTQALRESLLGNPGLSVVILL